MKYRAKKIEIPEKPRDYGDTHHFLNLHVICQPPEQLNWAGDIGINITPPLDPPPSIQDDLYDAEPGAIRLANPLGEEGWQPTLGRIKMWGTNVEYRHHGHACTITPIFDGAERPNDAIRNSWPTRELAIQQAQKTKKRLIEMHETRMRDQWVVDDSNPPAKIGG